MFLPLNNFVVVERLQKDTGGLRISLELEREGVPDSGVIVAVPKFNFLNWIKGIRVGKTIAFVQYSPVKLSNDQDHYFVKTSEILGILQ